MAKKKRNKGGAGGGPRKSNTTRVLHTLGAVAVGGAAGAILGRGSLAAGVGAIIYGVSVNNPLIINAGVAACVVKGQLDSSERSTAGGVKGIIEDARTSLKNLAATTYQKTMLDKVAPNLLPSLSLGEIDGVDYYADMRDGNFNAQMGAIAGADDDYGVSGYPELEMGRVEGNFQNYEVGQENIGALAGADLSTAAANVSAGW